MVLCCEVERVRIHPEGQLQQAPHAGGAGRDLPRDQRHLGLQFERRS